ncbi:DUF2269 family protein [Streptomonospora algeriensis]|uniref:DUF2269 family protein n=1 Tax=Streptomonospora algeriensis TaxID=995084 RepID=A0ABW3BH61_9ACTN
MTKFLLSIHVLAAIVAIGPITVAASMFPARARRALAGSGADGGFAVLRTLHRICRVYAAVGIAVPVFGFATAHSLGVLGDAWLITSIALTAAAAGVLGLLILPRQQRLLDSVPNSGPANLGSHGSGPARLAMYTGVFNVLWAVVTVLMIVRPGSTTGV